MKRIVGAAAVLALCAHLFFLPPTLEDLDSVNFALGVRDFNVAQHQPHPPGYPMFIALGKIATSVLSAAGVSAPDVRGLAVWSALGIAILPWLLFVFFRAIDRGDDLRAGVAALITLCCPLVWFSGIRPLSDIAGLAAAFGALALLAGGQILYFNIGSRSPRDSDVEIQDLTPMAAVVGALLAGIAIGFRVQMALLTVPFLCFVIVMRPRVRLALIGAAAAGVAIWAVPLVLLNGGPAGYVRALQSQAGEDFSGVVMLWTHRTVRVALAAFLHTFVRPWESPMLAGVLLALAGAGKLMLAGRSFRTLWLLALTFGPYLIFHLLFQETVTLRYGIPLIPLIAFLVAETIAGAGPRISLVMVAAIAVVGLAGAVPATVVFSKTPSPVFGLLSEMQLLQARGATPLVAMHRRVFTESRRARVYAGDPPGRLLAAPRDYEWLEVTRAWREGHDGETWFIADPRRTDLALIDREHTRIRQYRWPFEGSVFVGGARPDEIDWHVIARPGWFLEQGWALTPEIAGITDRDGHGPHRHPSIGWVRRRSGETLLMIGGRHLGGNPPVRVIAAIDDRQIATFEAKPGYFLDFLTLPAGTLEGQGTYAKLTVSVQSLGGGAVPPVAIEQFNLQDPDRVVWGYGDGWFEPELNPVTARSWRWMSEKAILRVHGGGQGVTVRIAVESPRRYFDRAPQVRISAGDRVLAETTPSADFTIAANVPADALSAANGQITITSDQSFVAGEREGTADPRRLALRVYSVIVERHVP
jgi:hypothetical protein